jgi:hypothetical protein
VPAARRHSADEETQRNSIEFLKTP